MSDEKLKFFKLLYSAIGRASGRAVETEESQNEREKASKKTRPNKTEDVSR